MIPGATWTIKAKNDLINLTVTLDSARLISHQEMTMNIVIPSGLGGICDNAGG